MPDSHRRPSPTLSPQLQETSLLSSSTTTSNSLALPALFSTIFITHRVSPLHLGRDALTTARLRFLAARLRSALVGDVIRGVELLGENDVAGRMGALEVVRIGWVKVGGLVGDHDGEGSAVQQICDKDQPKGQLGSKEKQALCIELRYEATTCTALLLPSLDSSAPIGSQTNQELDEQDLDELATPSRHSQAFLHLPLLLTGRMPAAQRNAVIEFLCTTFDCRVSALRLGTRSLTGALEGWLHKRGEGAGDVVITLGFYMAGRDARDGRADGSESGARDSKPEVAGLKTLEIAIPASDVRRFFTCAIPSSQRDSDTYSPSKRLKLAGRPYEEGWGWRTTSSSVQQPFITCLSHYLSTHLALTLFHPGVRVTRVACADGFSLSEARVRVAVPGYLDDGAGREGKEAVWRLLGGLIERARGTA